MFVPCCTIFATSQRTKKGKQNGAIFILKRQININMNHDHRSLTREHLKCGQSQESGLAKVVAPLYYTSATWSKYKHIHFASVMTAMPTHILPNELEVFSYVLANESSAKLWIQIPISKYDGGSRQSPNAVTAWQCPVHYYLGGRKEQKTIPLYTRGLLLVRQNLRFKIHLNSSFVSKYRIQRCVDF